MSRRRALPGADELFRSTGGPVPAPVPASVADDQPSPVALAPVTDLPAGADDDLGLRPRTTVRAPVRRRTRAAERRPTGRERHDEKITVYVSAEELLDLEQARLTLRADHGLAVDRGRIVREALAVVLADLEAKGEASILVRRLHGR
ncbi:MAG TPA: cobyrinic acid a,c-diamide synthase [Mycobacteriales bacterium]|nr:cobyrinic acid a,c-diamide synthase [Mycobacteriales bacterium]